MNTFESFKTMISFAGNVSKDCEVPVAQKLEENKDFEVRLYETNKYVVIKYNTPYDPSVQKEHEVNNERYEKDIYDACWKLIQYTQGKNSSNTKMKFLMPVFVQYERLNEETAQPRIMEVKVFVSLPKEFQQSEAPKPLDADVHFEVIPQFKCYVMRTHRNLISDFDWKEETEKLKQILDKTSFNGKYIPNKALYPSYDPPYKMFDRRDEIVLFAN